MQLPKMLLW